MLQGIILQVLKELFGTLVRLRLGAQIAPEEDQEDDQVDQQGPPDGLPLVAAHGLPGGPPPGVGRALGEAQRLRAFGLLGFFGRAVEAPGEEAEGLGRPVEKTEGGW